MDRVAIFVDAGYLFAQGSTALTGSKKARTALAIDAPKAVEALHRIAASRAPDCRMLRIYWYDGAISGSRPTTDQALLAHLDDVKLRLGFVNSNGEQKGVDSLIVTDLIELARLKSVSDAVLLSGDEDVRVGVQIAQNYGVRVHLLGIVPSRGSQSQQLLQEADTTTEWSAEEVAAFLSVREMPTEPHIQTPEATTVTTIITQTVTTQNGLIEEAVDVFVGTLTQAEIQGVAVYWETERGVPAEFDRKLLPRCRDVVGRPLERPEIKAMRSRFQQAIKTKLAAL
jgi:uncharacterized LabA/DUF88 family protein